jgi:hypothetical protein
VGDSAFARRKQENITISGRMAKSSPLCLSGISWLAVVTFERDWVGRQVRAEMFLDCRLKLKMIERVVEH